MRYTNNFSYRRKRRNRKLQLTIRLICMALFLVLFVTGAILLLSKPRNKMAAYETATYGDSIYKTSFFSEDICVTSEEIKFEEFRRHDEFHGALLFDIEAQEPLYAEHIHDKLFPASTTKILTTYVALKYGDLTDYVTVSKNAVNVPSDSSSAHLQLGDVLTLEDLLYALMLPSGNDSAVAIAEHISGSVEEFADLMNAEARKLGATNTNFVNAHGYQNKQHYTTAYDLYLIFNECIKNDTFVDIISATKWTANITGKNGEVRKATWSQSNQFVNGGRTVPRGITMIGGKTGTTFDAGACILLYIKNANDTPYIAIIMGASSRRNLYDNMTYLLSAVPD